MEVEAARIVPIIRDAARLFYDRNKVGHVETKGYGNYVTEADKAVQSRIRAALADLYPTVQFYAEEKDNGDVDLAGDFWILDPIDGTMNLMRDCAHSAISLGYAEGGVLVLGIIYDPFRDEMFYGEQGKGAYMLQDASLVIDEAAQAADAGTDTPDQSAQAYDGEADADGGDSQTPAEAIGNAQGVTPGNAPWRPIHVSEARSLSESLSIVGTSPYMRDTFGNQYMEMISRVFYASQDIRRFGAAVLDFAWVACGRAEVYLEHVYPWDRAAGLVIVREAGGKVCSFDGSDVPVTTFHDVIAGAPAVVDEAVEITREIFG